MAREPRRAAQRLAVAADSQTAVANWARVDLVGAGSVGMDWVGAVKGQEADSLPARVRV